MGPVVRRQQMKIMKEKAILKKKKGKPRKCRMTRVWKEGHCQSHLRCRRTPVAEETQAASPRCRVTYWRRAGVEGLSANEWSRAEEH